MHLCSLHLHLATTVRYVIISEAYLFPSYSEPMCPAVHTRDTLPISLLPPSLANTQIVSALMEHSWHISQISDLRETRMILLPFHILSIFTLSNKVLHLDSGTIFSGFVPILAGRRELNDCDDL